MSFLTGLKDSISSISLKSVPGGTIMGNALRGIIHAKTDGAFGNGAMLREDGESDEAYKARMIAAAGSASAAFEGAASESAGSASPISAFKIGVIKQKLMKFLPLIIGAVVLLVVAKKFIFKKKRY